MDLDAGSLAYEWFHQSGNCQSIEMFLTQKYLQLHDGHAEEKSEHERDFKRQLAQWEEIDREFDADYQVYSGRAELTEWQAVEMLENVMQCFNMTDAQKWKYLSNVQLACDNQVADRLCETYRTSLDQAYDEAMKCANQPLDEQKMEEMLAQTVAAMRRTRLAYDDETRALLTELSLDPDAVLPDGLSAEGEREIRLITNFVVAGMVQSDKTVQLSSEECRMMVEQVVPTCVSAAMIGSQERDAGRAMMLAQAKLGASEAGNSANLLAMVGITMFAAAVALKIICAGIATTGTVMGLYGLWTCCKDAFQHFLGKKEHLDTPGFAGSVLGQSCDEKAGESEINIVKEMM